MITAKDILSYNFYTYKQPFSGSYRGMRYRIVRLEKPVPEDAPEGTKPEKVFSACVWPEPYAYDATPKEEMTFAEFPFDEEGHEQVVAWLNEKWEEFHK